MWRSWMGEPPQIPWAPVVVSMRGVEDLTLTVQPEEFNQFPWGDIPIWKPTGIYREEFFQVTRRWE